MRLTATEWQGAKRRRPFPWIHLTLALLLLSAWGGLWLSSLLRLGREPPNYVQIEPWLYMGGRVPEPPPGTGAVLNLDESPDPYERPVYRWEPIRDSTPAPSIDWLRQQVEFLEAQRRDKVTTYVHCLNGVSRSGLVVVAYEMYRKGWNREEALGYVRSRRPGLRPNPAFMELLREWQGALAAAKKEAD